MASRKKAIAKPESVEKHESKPMPPVDGEDGVGVRRISLTRHEGPLPSSQEIARYKKVQKDFPERMMRMAEKDQEQRHKHMDLAHDRAQIKEENKSRLRGRGQWLAFFVILAILAILGIDTDKEWWTALVELIDTYKEWWPALVGLMALPLLIGGYFRRLTAFFTKDKNKKK